MSCDVSSCSSRYTNLLGDMQKHAIAGFWSAHEIFSYATECQSRWCRVRARASGSEFANNNFDSKDFSSVNSDY